MDFIILQSFNNYIDAHLLMGRLESEGIECWLQDENTVTINPVWTNAVGGIKLMVKKEDAVLARQILWEIETNRKQTSECPKCKGHNIELVSTPRKPGNWLSVLWGFITFTFAPPVEQTNHCFDCGHEFENVNETSTEA